MQNPPGKGGFFIVEESWKVFRRLNGVLHPELSQYEFSENMI